MVQLVLLRPGSTDYDHQSRIQGVLNIPLNEAGQKQAAEAAEKLQIYTPRALYCSPSRSAEETAAIIGHKLELKPKSIDRLQNVNLGLWQGMLVEEVRIKQPKVYKQWQEHPETIQPPDGEMLATAVDRAMEALQKLARKHRSGTIALVIPEPLATLIQHRIQGIPWSDLWQAPNGCCRIEAMNLEKNAPHSIPAPKAEKLSSPPTATANGPATESRIHGPTSGKLNGLHPAMVYRGVPVRPQ